MRTLAFLFLFTLLVSSLSAGADDEHADKAAIPPFPLTAVEEADARSFAQERLTSALLLIARSPEAYHLEGVNLSEPRLGGTFLDVTLRGRSIDDYRDSAEDDPRLFPGVLYYCFPVFVAGRQDAILSIVVVRNRDENRQPFPVFRQEGPKREEQYPQPEFLFFGYYLGGQESWTVQAVRLRNQYRRRISFVKFLDTGLPGYIMVDDSTSVLCGAMGDTLASVHDEAPRIKRALRKPR
jgi:hypothetical protein